MHKKYPRNPAWHQHSLLLLHWIIASSMHCYAHYYEIFGSEFKLKHYFDDFVENNNRKNLIYNSYLFLWCIMSIKFDLGMFYFLNYSIYNFIRLFRESVSSSHNIFLHKVMGPFLKPENNENMYLYYNFELFICQKAYISRK